MVDKKLFFYSSLLIIIGVIFSYSLSVHISVLHGASEFHYFIKAFIIGIISIGMMWALSLVDPHKLIMPLGMFFFIFFFFLMFSMNFLPSFMVTEAGGAKRWIRLPFFSISPIEFFKIGFITFLAWSFNRKLFKKRAFIEEIKVIVPYFLVFMLTIILVAIMQNDLGQSIVLAGIIIVMFVFAGISAKLFFYSSIIIALAIFVLIKTFPHRINRVYIWWANIQDFILKVFPNELADSFKVEYIPQHYQIERSLDAMTHGGLIGVGLGNSHYKYGFLPDIHTDFAFSGIIEEMGILVGIIIIIFFIFGVLYRVLKIANRVPDITYSLFCVGIFMLLVSPFLMNILGISGLTPIKGIGFPFISYGGSATLSLAVAVGMVLSISKLKEEKR
jgi:cell division protein FtsW